MFLLAHLSDPHLGPPPVPPLRELSGKRALGYLNWLRNRRLRHRRDVLDAIVQDLKSAAPDHVVVTGDLVNLALHGEFAPARLWLSHIGSPHDVTIVPGNHDAYMRDAVPHSTHHWGEYMRGDGPGLASPVTHAADFPFVRRRGPLALVGLSTAVPTGPLLATGRLGPDQLMRLEDALGRLAHEGLFRVVLIHHPPHSSRAHHLKRLIDAGPFKRVIATCGAELVLHGHSHVRSLTWLDGPRGRIPALGVPSASASPQADNEPAAYNLFRIERDEDAWRCDAVMRGLRHGSSGIVELGRHRLAG